MSDAQLLPSCGAPADFFLRSVPIRSSTPARFCASESAARAAAAPVADRESTRGMAEFFDFEFRRLFPIDATLRAREFVRLAPGIRVRAHSADGAAFGSSPAHRSTAATLPNPHQAGRW